MHSTLKMWAAWVCLWACVGAVAGSGYGCEPVTVTVTQLNTIAQKVPIHQTVYRQKVIPTTVFNKVHYTKHNTVLNRQHVPELVTTTQYNPELVHVTVLSTVYEHHDVTDYIVNQKIFPQTVTEVAYETIWKTDTALQTVRKTDYAPRYVTKTDIQVETVVDTVYSTAYETILHTTTVLKDNCAYSRNFAHDIGGYGGNAGYGYGY